MKNKMMMDAMLKMAKAKKLGMGGYADGGEASSQDKIDAFETSDRRAAEANKKREEEERKRENELNKGKKKVSPKYYADGGQVIGGPLKEMKAKRRTPYDGNELQEDELQSELEGQNFAKGGMADKKKGAVLAIVAKLAKKPMSESMKMNGEHDEPDEDNMGGPSDYDEDNATPADMAKLSAASEMVAALKEGNAKEFAMSLETFINACHEAAESSEEEVSEHEKGGYEYGKE
jgi:predicted HicB family RNase H-like nuclease